MNKYKPGRKMFGKRLEVDIEQNGEVWVTEKHGLTQNSITIAFPPKKSAKVLRRIADWLDSRVK